MLPVDDVLTADEVARYLRVHPMTVQRWCRTGDLPAAKSLTRLLTSTGVGSPVIAITTEGGLSAMSSDWGVNDVILDTAGPAEVEARIRMAIGEHAETKNALDPTSGEIRSGHFRRSFAIRREAGATCTKPGCARPKFS